MSTRRFVGWATLLSIALLACPVALPCATALASDDERSEQQAYLFDVIKTRRTVRAFRSTPVPEEHIMMILDAARCAPTAGNQQPWKFLVIRDRAKLDRLKKEALTWYLGGLQERKEATKEELETVGTAVQGILDNVLSAPVYVAVLVDSTAPYPDYVVYDGTLAAGSLMIAARGLGYGTGFFTTFFPGERMKAFLGIPPQYQLICFTPIGVPEEWPETPPKKALGELVVFESFGP
jgi:nitroreductase